MPTRALRGRISCSADITKLYRQMHKLLVDELKKGGELGGDG